MDCKLDFKEYDLIKFDYLFSKTESKIGIVIKIEEDANFSYMVTMLSESRLEKIPYGIIESTIL